MQLRATFRVQDLFAWHLAGPSRASGTAWLDGLRGVAALQVLLFHFFARYPEWARSFGNSPSYFYQWPVIRTIWAGGSGAVALFFVISGYAITIRSLTLLRQRQHDQLYRELCSSLIRRGFRLYLPVLILAIPSILVVQYLHLNMAIYVFRPEPKSSLFAQIGAWFKSTDHLVNPYFYPDHDPNFDGYPYVPTSWTIPLEFSGSILCYVVVMAVSRIEVYRIRAYFTVGMAAYALHRGSWWNSSFLVGLSMADCALETSQGTMIPVRRPLRNTGFLLIFIVGVWLSGAPPKTLPYEEPRTPRPGFELLYGLFPPESLVLLLDPMRWYYYWSGNLIFIGVSQLPSLQRLFEAPFCQWLGKLSFSIYLLHGVVYAVLTDPIRAIFSPFVDNSSLLRLLEFGIMIPITFILGGLFERYVDVPSIKFARKFERYVTQEAISERKGIIVTAEPYSRDST